MSRVAVIGDALIDIVDGQQIPGGAALNVAVGLAKLGVGVDLVCMLADDEPGRALREHARRHDVRIHATAAPHGTATATATRVGDSMEYVFNEAGRRRFVELDEATDVIGAADGVVVSCVPLEHDTQCDQLEAAQRPGRPFVLDANPRPGYLIEEGAGERFAAGLLRLAAGSTLVKLSDEDARLLYGADPFTVARRMLGSGLEAALITEGPSGASVMTASETVRAPAAQLPGPIVDTIGAGDATTASVTQSLLAGDIRWDAALGRAMRIAAATCRGAGGELRLP